MRALRKPGTPEYCKCAGISRNMSEYYAIPPEHNGKLHNSFEISRNIQFRDIPIYSIIFRDITAFQVFTTPLKRTHFVFDFLKQPRLYQCLWLVLYK